MDTTAIQTAITRILGTLPEGVSLVAVSKFHPAEAVLEAYACGQRLFGENRPQELAEKAKVLPGDIRWHFIGHLQTNKLKMVLPYAALVESVDSVRLLDAIIEYVRSGRNLFHEDGVARILLELHLGEEESKHGLSRDEIMSIIQKKASGLLPEVEIMGLMGMATNTDDTGKIRGEFHSIRQLFDEIKERYPSMDSFRELSIGMSGDYPIAMEEGATIVRIGTTIFGARQY